MFLLKKCLPQKKINVKIIPNSNPDIINVNQLNGIGINNDKFMYKNCFNKRFKINTNGIENNQAKHQAGKKIEKNVNVFFVVL